MSEGQCRGKAEPYVVSALESERNLDREAAACHPCQPLLDRKRRTTGFLQVITIINTVSTTDGQKTHGDRYLEHKPVHVVGQDVFVGAEHGLTELQRALSRPADLGEVRHGESRDQFDANEVDLRGCQE